MDQNIHLTIDCDGNVCNVNGYFPQDLLIKMHSQIHENMLVGKDRKNHEDRRRRDIDWDRWGRWDGHNGRFRFNRFLYHNCSIYFDPYTLTFYDCFDNQIPIYKIQSEIPELYSNFYSVYF